MTIAISVRRATESDAPVLAALVNRAYEVERFFVEGPRTSPDEIVQMMESGSFLVLEYEHGLAASVFMKREAGHVYLGMLSVDPALQGAGLGKRLVRIVEALGEALGDGSVGLRVVHLREELLRWYKNLGFVEVGTSPYDHASKQPCHFVEMRRMLGAPLPGAKHQMLSSQHAVGLS